MGGGVLMGVWYAVKMDGESEWEYGSADYDRAVELLIAAGGGTLGVMDGDNLIEELRWDDLAE